jgi:hypothetical protein
VTHPNAFVISRRLEIKIKMLIYVGRSLIGARKMRISLADSLRHGFKKWSDAQDAKPPPTQFGHLAASAERRRPIAADGEGHADDVG